MSKELSSVIQLTIASHGRAITVNEFLQSLNVEMQALEERDCIEQPFSAVPGATGDASLFWLRPTSMILAIFTCPWRHTRSPTIP
jgi:hypothetical protein